MKEFKAKYDVCIPNEMLRLLYDVNERITKAECLILIDILQRGGLNHETPVSRKQLAIDCKISEASVKRALQRLKESGIISYERGTTPHAPSMLSLDFERVPFTQVPASAINALLETPLSHTAIRLLLFVWRYTYGYKGGNGGCIKSCKMSDTFINEGTHIDEKNAQRAIRELKSVEAIGAFIHNNSRFIYPCDIWAFFSHSAPVNLTPHPRKFDPSYTRKFDPPPRGVKFTPQ